ncbi:MAG: bifunctional phosphoribosyl-AMP cyclohydrolase/phosphoribosyl-ATP diphosphatase HisIE [Eubacterium sp.]|nr:bifunctional phosphoribosyl-AMP cyclohydrolase/phosphoribosyl-ATP diphosphatase HisIE [Eubacterium sp.]MCM1216152.1 bifunctional phosphoribosyl-AMP cyclohydrolase/phosphoribosyl-ATP diphosphatase HisIE [Lachnospiraceae bacterium]MCM1304545.1 bifunctional phosphoribosyl-AMP cyclohydrolase/phosphoribosyl-ATP diphosphatase HisIE [Butyrivibrio sp.]MCM1344190.1 bifunctional phosphoribosyl-AMP cyclohydrolase/phosphoribosyl-ATP diphosphatase HisIE [Muribaculaceae bacterium]MCM1239076.1 bifunctional
MITKKFVPCIYLYHEHAVRSLTDTSVVETDPLRLVHLYNEHNADELIVFDLSEGDEEHEAALDLIKEICEAAEVDVIGAGNIRRMEDVKKLLYAGCRKAILDYEKESNIAITEEVSLKFGRDKILVSYNDPQVIGANKDLVEKYASAMVLMNPHQIRGTQEITGLPFYVQINQIALNKLMEIFACDNVCGVTGNTINDNHREILSLKDLCRENGIQVEMFEAAYRWADFKLNSDGMVPVVVQDHRTMEVLMVAYMNEEAYEQTISTGKMTYFSRSRNELWLKGATSGHYQYVKSLTADCDMDTILAKVSQVGAACHTGARSCFFNEITKKDHEESGNPLQVFEEVFDVIKDRRIHPKEGSYTNYLFDKGIDKILKKLGEEATEIVIAAKNPNPNEIKYEISDFLYHMMVLMAEKDITWEEITTELANR